MNNFRNRLIYLLQTVGQLEGRADDVADAIIYEFNFIEWHRPPTAEWTGTAVVGWMPDE